MNFAELETWRKACPQPRPLIYYRKTLLEHIAMPKSDPWRLGQFWGLVAAFVALQWLLVTGPWFLAPLISVPLGLILVALFALLHEFMHYAITDSSVSAWLHAWLAGFYSGLTPDSWKSEHDAHHGSLGKPVSDPDAVYDLDLWTQLPGVRKGLRFLPGNSLAGWRGTRPL